MAVNRRFRSKVTRLARLLSISLRRLSARSDTAANRTLLDLIFSRAVDKRRRDSGDAEGVDGDADGREGDDAELEKDDMDCRGYSGADAEDTSGGRGNCNDDEENDCLPIV